MKIVIFIRIHNDFDHALPIIDYLIRYKHQSVIIYGLGKEYRKCNKHISYVENVLLNKIISFEDEFYLKHHKFYFGLMNSIGKFPNLKIKIVDLLFNALFSQVRRIVYYLASGSVESFVSQLSKKTVIMADFGTEGQFPYKYIIKKSQKKGIPIIAYLHGFYIWTNLNVMYIKKPKLPVNITNLLNKWLFAKGIDTYYDKYLGAPNAADTHFRSNLYPGFDKFERVVGIGIPRFSFEWIDRFARNGPVIRKINNDKIYVALFLSGENYEVNSESLKETVDWMINSNLINLTIKPHPRVGLSGLDKNNLPIASKVSELNSSDIIEWADVGILYGCSIALEMIIRNVVVVVPKYIDNNKTIIEEKNACIAVESLQELSNFFDKYSDDAILPSKSNIDTFIKEIIYGNNSSYEEMMDKYTYFLE